MPRVSVVVSHFDRQQLLMEALASIAGQTYRDLEVIVVNDHGADSHELVDGFAARAQGLGLKTIYDYLPVNGGVAAARNRGVALASGELIAYLDDDDLWMPDHLMGLVEMIDAPPECDLAYGDAQVWRMEQVAQVTGTGRQLWRPTAIRTLAVPFDLDCLKSDDFIVPGGMVHRRSLYDRVGAFDETLQVSDDWDWLLRAAPVATFRRLPRVVITVRIWPDGTNISARSDASRLAALLQIEQRHGTPPLEPKTFWEVAETYQSRRAMDRPPAPNSPS